MIVLYILLAALCIGMPVIIILKTNQSQKRLRQGATCGTAISATVRRSLPILNAKNPPGQSR